MAYLENINIKGTQTTSFVPDPKNFDSTNESNLKFDSVGNAKTRSAIFTDEGSFRYDFEGTSLVTSITGTLNLSNTTTTVIGVGTLFLTELQKGLFIKITTDGGTFWRQIEDIISDTELILDRPYPTTSNTTTCHYSWVSFNIGAGANVTNVNSIGTIALGTTALSATRISRKVDYPAVVGSTLLNVSQRIANQDIYIGFSEQSTSTAKYFAWFRLNGTDNRTLILETCGIKTGTPTASDIETQTVTLPAGLTTANNLIYRIEVKDQRVRFFINDIQIGRDFRTHIPSNYDILGWGIVGINGTTPASNTTINIDYFNVNNANEIAVYNPSLAESFLSEQPYFEDFRYSQTGVILVNTDLLIIDCSQYRSLSIQCASMGTAGVITGQWSSDETLTARQSAQLFDPIGGGVGTTFNTTALRITNVMARYFILRLTTGTTAGTTTLIVNGSHSTIPTFLLTQTVAGTVTANIGSGAISAGTNLIGDVGHQYRANATGGASRFHLVSASTTNSTIVKSSAGRLLGWQVTNTNAAFRYVKLHNQATLPTAGAGVFMVIGVPPNQTINFNMEGGIACGTGIGITTVTGAIDTDTTSVGASDLIIDIFFA